ncbi:MAG TPA: imidazolonepropionase [Bacteroidia bacterium]|nr:imidazolonepropionase [Bacteroidia bacterium]HMU19509.1 imidazolonepropionase [Bacteroidia bacterium]
MIVILNIKGLCGILENDVIIKRGQDLRSFKIFHDAFLAIKDGLIENYGTMTEWESVKEKYSTYELVQAEGKYVMPGWCDPHTHLVYAASREEEFVDRINGLSYEDIAQRGGGILNSAKKLAVASEEYLFQSAMQRIDSMIAKGTTSIEIKSGYGLSLESELKMLRVIRRIKESLPLNIKSTFLGAHAVPEKFKNNKTGYVRHVIDDMIPAIAAEKLADYCDVFCERNYFTQQETEAILNAGTKFGLIPKVHANQMSRSGGVQAGVNCNAISVDHLEFVEDEEIAALKNSTTMPVVLPGAAFFLSLPLPPARKMIDAGLPLAVATDFNPGSSPSGDMNFMISLLCVQYKLNPEEAFNAATINAAYAMNISHTTGSISIGKRADFFITKKITSPYIIPYSFNENVMESVYVKGKKVV